jgi:hypothetical protein
MIRRTAKIDKYIAMATNPSISMAKMTILQSFMKRKRGKRERGRNKVFDKKHITQSVSFLWNFALSEKCICINGNS